METKKSVVLTEKNILKLSCPENAQYIKYYDKNQRGLAVMVTKNGAKTYYFCLKFHGVPKRVKIARVGDIKLSDARLKAAEMLISAQRDGVEPGSRRRDELKDITLQEFYTTQYKPNHSIPYKRPKSIEKDDSMFKNYLKSLYNRKMMSITTLDLEQLHNKLRSKISPYTANRVLTLIKHMYSKAHAWGYPEQYKNPAVGIKMFKEKSRDRFLHSDEVQRFFTELYTEPNKRFRNFVLLSLFVGQRKMNMLSIRWSDVDMQNGFIYFPDTKNGESQRIPLTKYSLAVLEDMRKDSSTGYLFYSETSKSGHIEDFHRPWYALLKRANIENFRFHDLRRTFGSYQAINGASLQIIGKSLGHKSSAATLVYSRLSVDPIRESMEQGTGLMIETAKASLK